MFGLLEVQGSQTGKQVIIGPQQLLLSSQQNFIFNT